MVLFNLFFSNPGSLADNLKDLLRFLRRDDPQTREVFKQVCKWNIVGKDLIPIIEYCQDDRNLLLNAGICLILSISIHFISGNVKFVVFINFVCLLLFVLLYSKSYGVSNDAY